MTLPEYHQLSAFGQLYYVLRRGLFLARRFEAHVAFNLYHCADQGVGWFVEVCYDEVADVLAVVRSSTRAEDFLLYGDGLFAPE